MVGAGAGAVDDDAAALRGVLAHLVTALQDPWFGFGWSTTDLAVLAAYTIAAGAPALWFFRWN